LEKLNFREPLRINGAIIKNIKKLLNNYESIGEYPNYFGETP